MRRTSPMTEGSPLVSVVMPAYNAEPWLHEAVDSILSQTYKNIELIAVDDGSVDRTPEILRAYAGRDRRVRVVNQDHAGIPRTRNLGIRHARGELIAWLDADDIALPTRLGLQIEHLMRFPDCVGVGAQVLYIDPDGDPIGRVESPCEHEQIDAHLLIGRGSTFQQTTMTVRKGALESVGGYLEALEISSDIDLGLKLAEQGRLANLPEVLVLMRRHWTSISARQSPERMHSVREQIIREALARRGAPESFRGVFGFHQPTSEEELYERWIQMATDAKYHETAAKYRRRLLNRSNTS